MEATGTALARTAAFARAMDPELPQVDEGLAAARRLLAAAGVPYVVVGGVAVVHHGYARTTRDLELLLEHDSLARLRPLLASHGFEAAAENRWRHLVSGVSVALRFAGRAMPRPGAPAYPHPRDVARSPRENDVAGLSALVEMKLHAGRHQDVADVVELLKRLDEPGYLAVESVVASPLRRRLYGLRQDAMDELSVGEPPPA